MGKSLAKELGKTLEAATIADLGSAARIVIDKDNTTIVDGKGKAKDVKDKIAQIKMEIENTTSDYDREKLQERLAKLSGGVAVIKVGAPSEVEMKEKKDRVDDALSATKAAVDEGIVIGGGSALIRASQKVKLKLEGDEAIGYDIIKRAIKAPLAQIATNAGYDAGVVVNEVRRKNPKDGFGFNAASGEYVDMFKDGIIDPLKIYSLWRCKIRFLSKSAFDNGSYN